MAKRTRTGRRIVAAALGAGFLAFGLFGAASALDGEVKIGEINSYSALPSFTDWSDADLRRCRAACFASRPKADPPA